MNMRLSLLLLLSGACATDITAPFDVPPDYNVWWTEASECADVAAPLGRIHWEFVDAIPDAPKAVGRWQAPHHIMIVAFHRDTKAVVQHEMLHDLLQAGDEAHEHQCFAIPHS